MSINKRKLCVNVLIHEKDGKVIYYEHAIRSLYDSFTAFPEIQDDIYVLLFLNGGLWDNHQKVMSHLKDTYPGLQFIFSDSKEMLNIGIVRNKVAYDCPVSEFFIHMDGDDEVPVSYFKSLFSNMKSDVTRFRFVWKNIDSEDIVPNSKHFSRHLMFSDYLPNVTYLFNRKWYIESGLKHPEDLQAGEDIFWSVMLHLHMNHLNICMDPIYIYRNDLSQMSTNQKKNKSEIFEETQKILRYFQSQMFNLDLLPEYHVTF